MLVLALAAAKAINEKNVDWPALSSIGNAGEVVTPAGRFCSDKLTVPLNPPEACTLTCCPELIP
jgi:hypothetical protein